VFFDSLQFKAVESSLNALSIKQQVISQNIANKETPNYKQKNVSFANILEDAVGNKDNKKYNFQVTITEDTNTTINVDGNNVDSDQQAVELYATYLQHAALVEKINATFTQLRVVSSANFN
jgi:flagellar basal-body rod protein FlgB